MEENYSLTFTSRGRMTSHPGESPGRMASPVLLGGAYWKVADAAPRSMPGLLGTRMRALSRDVNAGVITPGQSAVSGLEAKNGDWRKTKVGP